MWSCGLGFLSHLGFGHPLLIKNLLLHPFLWGEVQDPRVLAFQWKTDLMLGKATLLEGGNQLWEKRTMWYSHRKMKQQRIQDLNQLLLFPSFYTLCSWLQQLFLSCTYRFQLDSCLPALLSTGLVHMSWHLIVLARDGDTLFGHIVQLTYCSEVCFSLISIRSPEMSGNVSVT